MAEKKRLILKQIAKAIEKLETKNIVEIDKELS